MYSSLNSLNQVLEEITLKHTKAATVKERM